MDQVLPVLRRHASEVDENASFPSESLTALRTSGLLGSVIPSQHGGWGMSLSQFVETAQLLAGACLTSASIWAMHCQQADALARYGNQGFTDEILPQIAAGQVYLASVTTEPVKGGHALSAHSAALHSDEYLSFDRKAPVVTGGRHADGFLITLRASATAPETQVSLIYADRSQLRIEQSGDWRTLGMRGTDSVSLHLKGKVPDRQVIGGHGGFREVAVESYLPMAHIGWSACWLGAAKGVFAELVQELRRPGRRGGPQLSSDLVRERLARIRLDLELVHSYLQRVVSEVEQCWRAGQSVGEPVQQIHLNSLKLCASELCYRAVDRMIELAGLSLGYSKDSVVPLERCLRDLRSASLNYSNERLLTVTGAMTLMDRSVRLA
ncbi:acyl-CoA dehydrogenase [Streptomyces natalensis ATCC 27448]|uniref:Acyl-CoA dehydrogenase n=1 Tax=Streptomyces natalensis ATCC 27448 TaxID=1240678 RepID=A0A0D7CI68_9ACTN|nr:acyl-CoA dehydrogenase [Streptomyces natalensis ATCC 27448]